MSTDKGPTKGGKETPHRDEESSLESTGFEFVPLSPEKAPKGPARYRDPANPFNTWTGIGKRPEWLRQYIAQGRALSEFEIKEE